jgi:hypothetical protein
MATSRFDPLPNSVAYSWMKIGSDVYCFTSPQGWQTVTNRWEATELTPFHDAELAQATKDINSILMKVQKNNKDRSRTLSFVQYNSRHFLVWAKYDAVGPYDDHKKIEKELRLKTGKRR